MPYELKELTELNRDLSLESKSFRDEFHSKYIDKISELQELISDIKGDYKIFKENYVEQLFEEDNYEIGG